MRQDLCNRHQVRHFARGRQDQAASNTNASLTTAQRLTDPDEISALVARGSSNAPSQRANTAPEDRAFLSSKESETSDDEINRLLTSEKLAPSQQSSGAVEGYAHGSDQLVKSHRHNPLYNVAFSPEDRIRQPPQQPHQRSRDGSFGGGLSMMNPGDPTLQSPLSLRDEFAGWLFDDFNTVPNPFSGGVSFASAADGFGNQVYPNYFDDPSLDNFYSYPSVSPEAQMDAVSPVPILSSASSLLSSARREAILSLIELRFTEDDTPSIGKLREDVLGGDRDADSHVLSLRSLQNYIGSYWYHFHCQLPILHQPTFSADEAPTLLLLAIMAIGASYLHNAHGRRTIQNAAKFAAFVAWHLRWKVFRDPDARPPAKLWVFQTLILLGIYEKMNSSRALHERAHIHSATSIILMRRGTALVDDDGQQRSSQATSAAQWWSRWIQAEATRRAAFAAFYLDALSATTFGHNAMMVVHEVRLPLPCDDALWSATSAEEVGRVEASLHANGVQPTTFTDALRKILTGRKVRTNLFGRMILMAGLLSISWHMQQRDLQTAVLGESKGLPAVPSSWRDSLSKSFDFWKKDFDESMAHMQRVALPWQTSVTSGIGGAEADSLKTATILWRLGHMHMHVDFRDCQILAGTKSNLGRPITDADRERAKNNINVWTKSSGGRTAVYHALQALRETFLSKSSDETPPYNARDDHLVVRPYTLFIAGLVVWCWGFMVDGLLRPYPSHLISASSPNMTFSGMKSHPQSLSRSQSGSLPHTRPSSALNGNGWEASEPIQAANFTDAKLYLQTIGAANSPQELEGIKAGRNNVIGLLRTLEFAFRDSRWELLHEAGERLRGAVCMLER